MSLVLRSSATCVGTTGAAHGSQMAGVDELLSISDDDV
jgi:hypothetical protein